MVDRSCSLDRTIAFPNLWDSQKNEDHHCHKNTNLLYYPYTALVRSLQTQPIADFRSTARSQLRNYENRKKSRITTAINLESLRLPLHCSGQVSENMADRIFAPTHDRISECMGFANIQNNHCRKLAISSVTLTLFRSGFCKHCRSLFCLRGRTIEFPNVWDSQKIRTPLP